MNYRAGMIGGNLEVRPDPPQRYDRDVPVPNRELHRPHREGPMGVTHQTASGASKNRVFVVDDHPIVRQGLALLINREPDLTVCGEAEEASGRDAADSHG